VWESYAFRFLGGSVLLLGVLPAVLRLASLTKDYGEGVIVGTGVAIVWYTVETHAMRKEMTRQNALQVQPFVFVTAILSQPDTLVLRNMGRGAALHVQIEDIEFIVDGGATPEYVAKFSTVDVIEAGNEVRATTELTHVREGQSQRLFSFVSGLDPRFQRNLDLPVIISYQDIHAVLHKTHLTMGKSGTRLIRYA